MATNGGSRVTDVGEDMAGRLSEGVESLRGYADTADARIRAFARERPMAAVAIAVGLGFLLGRLASRT